MLCFNDQNTAFADQFTDFIIWTSGYNVSSILKTLNLRILSFDFF